MSKQIDAEMLIAILNDLLTHHQKVKFVENINRNKDYFEGLTIRTTTSLEQYAKEEE